MIQKLYDLKNLQKNQLLIKKKKLHSRVVDIEATINITQQKINTTTIDAVGTIRDFSILEMHKNTLRQHIVELNKEKIELLASIDILNKEIIVFQKESEQFDHILQEQKKEYFQKILSNEALAAEEYTQSRFIKQKKGYSEC